MPDKRPRGGNRRVDFRRGGESNLRGDFTRRGIEDVAGSPAAMNVPAIDEMLDTGRCVTAADGFVASKVFVAITDDLSSLNSWLKRQSRSTREPGRCRSARRALGPP